jgi:hypothetical protein
MHETTTLHFDLSHLSPEQPFTLHVGSSRYDLAPHDRRSLARARRSNSALGLVADHRITHFAGPVRLPGDAPMLLRVTAPKLRPDDLLDRLVLTSLHLPRRYRMAALARQPQTQTQWQPQTQGRLAVNAKLAAYGLTDDGTGLPPDKQVVIDVADFNTATDAAASLIFHHTELMTLQPAHVTHIVNDVIYWVAGLDALAQSILDEAQAHEADPKNPNWVNSLPGTNWKTGKPDPAHPVYMWSENTLANLKLPLGNALQQTKADPTLEGQCWTVQTGITKVGMEAAPPTGELGGPSVETYTVKELTPQSGVENSFDYSPTTRTGTVNLKNYYLRWLQITVDQYGPGNEPVGTRQALGVLSPVDTIMAVPLPPDDTPFSFSFVEKASRATVSFGGLGQAPFSWPYDGTGIVLTALFNYAIPTMFIVLGVGVDQAGEAWSELTKQVAPVAVAIAEAAYEGPLATAVTGPVDLPSVLLTLANLDGALLTSVVASSEQLGTYITGALGESAAESAEPFLGWAALAIGAAADAASMVETSVEVARSPATMSIDIDLTMNVRVEVSPDIRDGGGKVWPQNATRYTISVTYDDGPVYAFDGSMSPTAEPVPIDQTFAGLPAGGNITVMASFYSDTGWLAGHGVTKPTEAKPDENGTLRVAFAIEEFLVPLSATTTYTLKKKLVYTSGAHAWAAPPAISAPTATESDLDGAPDGNHLSELGQLTVDQQSRLGYLWRASGQNVPRAGVNETTFTGQEYTYQALTDVSSPQAGLKFSGVGYISMPCLAFPPPSMATSLADGFLLEPDDANKLMHLRAMSLTPGQPMIASAGQSFGRFTYALDDLAIHPAGYAVALDATNCKLEVVRLKTLVADASAPAAAILSGKGTRPGLLELPVAVACSLDKILVLQRGSKDLPQGSVCAFDVKGNPAPWYKAGPSVMPLHPEGSANVEVLDLSIEAKGYMYVLKCLKSATGVVLPSDYRLDIYNPDGTFLTQVAGLAAARLQVDLWRNVFTLNYEIVQGSGRTEPSVSEWIPSTPGTNAATQGDG